MDVGDPSNFVRIEELFDYQTGIIQEHISGYRISDKETKESMHELYDQHRYLADPHGAVGYAALKKYLKGSPGQKGIFLETAHPIKFGEEVESIIGKTINVPPAIAQLQHQQKQSIPMKPDFDAFKSFLWDKEI